MTSQRMARQVLTLGAVTALVLAFGPMEAYAFSPQRTTPKPGAVSPSANTSPVMKSPATVPQAPAVKGKVFPKVEMNKAQGMYKVVVPKVGGEEGGAKAPGSTKFGDITLKRGVVSSPPQGVPAPPPPDYKKPAEFMPGSPGKPGEEKMGISPNPFKPGGLSEAATYTDTHPTQGGAPESGESKMGVEPTPWKPGGAGDKMGVEPSPFKPGDAGDAMGVDPSPFKPGDAGDKMGIDPSPFKPGSLAKGTHNYEGEAAPGGAEAKMGISPNPFKPGSLTEGTHSYHDEPAPGALQTQGGMSLPGSDKMTGEEEEPPLHTLPSPGAAKGLPFGGGPGPQEAPAAGK